MGCPPDPMEVSMWRSNERAREQEAKEKTLRREFDNLLKLMTPVMNAAAEMPAVKKLLDRCNRLNAGVMVPAAPEESSGYMQDADVQEAYANEAWEEAKAKGAETKLCNLRDFLVNAWELPDVKERFKELQTQVEKEIAAHALHREEDRTTWLAWLKEKKEMNEWLVKDASDENLKSRYAERLRKIEAEMIRVQQLSAREVLMDCTLFGRNSRDFDPFGI